MSESILASATGRAVANHNLGELPRRFIVILRQGNHRSHRTNGRPLGLVSKANSTDVLGRHRADRYCPRLDRTDSVRSTSAYGRCHRYNISAGSTSRRRSHPRRDHRKMRRNHYRGGDSIGDNGFDSSRPDNIRADSSRPDSSRVGHPDSSLCNWASSCDRSCAPHLARRRIAPVGHRSTERQPAERWGRLRLAGHCSSPSPTTGQLLSMSSSRSPFSFRKHRTFRKEMAEIVVCAGSVYHNCLIAASELKLLPPHSQIFDDVGRLAEPRLVNLIVLHDPLHIVPRLLEGDALDPIDDFVDRLAARIAVAA